jgi:sigma-B regulation protein RsbU (phosphoserine phosphatase)
MSHAAAPVTPDKPADPAGAQALAVRDEQLKQLRRDLIIKDFELETVLGLAQHMTAGHHSVEVLYRMLHFTLEGQRAVEHLLLFVRQGDSFQAKMALGRPEDELQHLQLPAAIAAAHIAEERSVEDFNLGPDWERYEMLIPVLRQQQVAGYVFIGGLRRNYDRQKLIKFLTALANTLLGAIENRRLQDQSVRDAAVRKEIEIAQDVQNRLFPQRLPNDADLLIEKEYRPHAEIGGDYYDVVEIDADRLLLCVADVSGKGVPASLLMSNFQAGLRTMLRQGGELTTVVTELNTLLFENANGEKFITAFLGIYNRRTRRLQYVNAGHNDPMLLGPDGAVQQLSHGTIILGIMEDLPMLMVGEVVVEPQSLLLLYTDGLTEIFDAQGNEFGEPGVLQVLQQYRHLPLAELNQQLLETTKKFNVNGDKFADDITILSCWFK